MARRGAAKNKHSKVKNSTKQVQVGCKLLVWLSCYFIFIPQKQFNV